MAAWNRVLLGAAMAVAAAAPLAAAAESPPRQADWVAPDFRFHTGEVMPLPLHYTTLGEPSNPAVLIVHGTAGRGTGLLSPEFGGELFGPGQPLDAAKYFIILPDTLGAGKSSKPSDGMHAHYPAYDYDDMVQAEYRLVTEGLGLHHLRLVLGNSMGGMHVWDWAVTYPDFMDALVPMASQPTAMAARNWMLRRLLIETIQADPDYKGGDYTSQPRSLRTVNALFGIATSGGTLAYQALAPTHAAADQFVAAKLASPPPVDANDYIYQWNASRDYDPSSRLGTIRAPLLAINSADDERNPPETGVETAALSRVAGAQLYLISASEQTRGHATTGMARFWAEPLRRFLATVPRRGT